MISKSTVTTLIFLKKITWISVLSFYEFVIRMWVKIDDTVRYGTGMYRSKKKTTKSIFQNSKYRTVRNGASRYGTSTVCFFQSWHLESLINMTICRTMRLPLQLYWNISQKTGSAVLRAYYLRWNMTYGTAFYEGL